MNATQPKLRLVVDTNVWMDFFLGNRLGSHVSSRLIKMALGKEVVLLYPLVSITNLYYLLRAEYKRGYRISFGALPEAAALAAEGQAWDNIRTLRELACAVGADESDLWLAERNHAIHRDLEDDLVIAAAQRAEASYLVTSDERLIAASPVATLAPDRMLALLEEMG